MYVSNPRNVYFDELPLDDNQSLITGRRIYCIKDDIVDMLNNGLIIDIYELNSKRIKV